MRKVKKTHCKYCNDEGIIWVKDRKTGKSTLYRCPYCEQGVNHPMQDLPLMSKKKKFLAWAAGIHFTGN